MSVNNYNNFHMPSLTGLVDINADSVTTTALQSSDIQTLTLEVNGVDIGAQVNENKQKLTGITYTPTPTPTTKLVNNLDITGQLIIRDTTDPNINMGIFYLPAGAGFRFINNVLNGYMYFSVKDGAGNIKNFQFSSSQFYANMPMYCDNNFNVSFNHDFTLGDTNFTTYFIGASLKYVPNSSVTSGLVFYNKGLNNNTAYYTNFTHNDLTNTETPTLRMNYNNIWSKVPHTFENSITGQNAIFNTTLQVIGTSTLATINGTSLYITGSSTFGSTITADSLSVVNATNLNGNLNAISTSNFIGTVKFTGNISANATTITPTQLSYISGATSNIQTQLNSKLNLTGGRISGNLTIVRRLSGKV